MKSDGWRIAPDQQPCLKSMQSHQIICTHAIACRLLPDLPRRGMRALAGYLGHFIPTLRRSADHASATTVIWTEIVLRLAEQDMGTSWFRLGITATYYPVEGILIL